MENLTDLEIAKALEQKAAYHEQMAASYRNAIQALEVNVAAEPAAEKPARGRKRKAAAKKTPGARRGRKPGPKPAAEKSKSATRGRPKTKAATKSKKRATKRTGKTFEQEVLEILSAGKPLTSREMLGAYNSATGRDLKISEFSGRLSQVINKKGSVKKHEIAGNPIDSRYYYGSADWFGASGLKKEYASKI